MCLIWIRTGWQNSSMQKKKKKLKGDFCQKRKSLKDIPARNIIPTHKTFVSKQFQKKSVSFSASLYLHDEFSSSW